MNGESGRVVVGYDGSQAADAAVDWAALEASRRRAPLTVLYAADIGAVIPGPLPAHRNAFEQAATAVTEAGVERARKAVTGVEVAGETHVARPSAVLVESSENALMLVVGTRGHGELAEAVLGSVASTVAAHAECPVVVVRGAAGPAGPTRPVVVGVDAWPHARSAVDFAADSAVSASAPLVIVSAYRKRLIEFDIPHDVWRLEYDGQPTIEEIARDATETTAGTALLHVRGAHPDVDVSVRVDEGSPARVLAEIGAAAGLLVVGAHGEAGFAAFRHGSVAHALVHTAPCPVAVVPGVSPA